MANADSAFWADLKAAIKAAWSDVGKAGHPILRADQVNRLNWMQMIDDFNAGLSSGNYGPPFCVVMLGKRSRESWGMCNAAWRYPIEIAYIRSTSRTTGEKSAKSTVAELCETKIAALKDQLLTVSTRHFQVIEPGSVEWDTSENNPANQAIYETNSPLYAGVLTVPLLVVESL